MCLLSFWVLLFVIKFGIYQLPWHFAKKQDKDEEGNDASDAENEDDISTVSSLPDFTPIEMFPPSDTACSDKVLGGDNFTVKEASSIL